MKQITLFLILTLCTAIALCQNISLNINDSSLTSFITDWIGKPYRLGGSTKEGIDCSQFNKKLAMEVYKVELENVCRRQWKQTERVQKDSLKVGDLVFFNSRYSPSGWHCGTYIGDSLFVHAANVHEGVKISSLTDSYYKSSYKGAGRYK